MHIDSRACPYIFCLNLHHTQHKNDYCQSYRHTSDGATVRGWAGCSLNCSWKGQGEYLASTPSSVQQVASSCRYAEDQAPLGIHSEQPCGLMTSLTSFHCLLFPFPVRFPSTLFPQKEKEKMSMFKVSRACLSCFKKMPFQYSEIGHRLFCFSTRVNAFEELLGVRCLFCPF